MPDPPVFCKRCQDGIGSSPRTRPPRLATHFLMMWEDDDPDPVLVPVCGVHLDRSGHPAVTLEEGLPAYVVRGVMGS